MLAIPQNRKDLLAITKLCETGEIKPMIDKHYSFDEIPEAFQYVWEGRAKGKPRPQFKTVLANFSAHGS